MCCTARTFCDTAAFGRLNMAYALFILIVTIADLKDQDIDANQMEL